MRIYSVREYNDGQTKAYYARIDARDVPPGVRRTGYQAGPPSAFEPYPGVPPVYDHGVCVDGGETLPCEVLLEDLTKCKVEAVRGEFAILAPAMTPFGVRRSTLRTAAIFESGFIVKISDLIAAAWGQNVAARPSDLKTKIVGILAKVDGKSIAECFDIYVKWMRGEHVNGVANRTREGGNAPLTPSQLLAAKDEWSRQLKAKTVAAKAEAKKTEDALVGWNPYEGDDL